MKTYQSETVSIGESSEKVFQVLSDFRNLDRVKAMIPTDKLKNLSFDQDSISIQTGQMGDMSVRIVERIPNKKIKFASEKSMVKFNLEILLEDTAETATQAQMILNAEIPFMLAPMISGYIQTGLDRAAKELTKIPYSEFQS